MSYADLPFNEQRLEDALDAAARLINREGIRAFNTTNLSVEIGYSRSWIHRYIGNSSDIRNKLIERHFTQLQDSCQVLRETIREINPGWPIPWRMLMQHLWGGDHWDYRIVRHHPGMLILARSSRDNESYAWLTDVQSVAFEIIEKLAPDYVSKSHQVVAGALNAAVGVLLMSAYQNSWDPVNQCHFARVASYAILTDFAEN